MLEAENYMLANPEWKEDVIPEIMDGKNVADFIDPDIAEKLDALEREEERLIAEGFYETEEDMVRVSPLFSYIMSLTGERIV
jgi:nucleolar GTP-binding protein